MMQKADKLTWAGRVISFLVGAPLLMGAIFMVLKPEQVQEGMSHLGWPPSTRLIIVTLELLCVALYWFPPTSVVGAILFTGYMGGAIATHLRIGEPVYIQTLLPILVWGGLYLREPRLWELMPIRKIGGGS